MTEYQTVHLGFEGKDINDVQFLAKRHTITLSHWQKNNDNILVSLYDIHLMQILFFPSICSITVMLICIVFGHAPRLKPQVWLALKQQGSQNKAKKLEYFLSQNAQSSKTKCKICV